MFWKVLNFINNIETKFIKLEEVTKRIFILTILSVVFIILLSSSFLAGICLFIMILILVGSLLYRKLQTKKDEDVK